ncbi:MAG: thioesterase [Flavobacteriales bacterium MED-G22]|nr:thioesterase family protein [Flavobacteriaceae bacterium]PDH43455.1 MAG: thioesterase [Flavobacteriales bacterium MED-G22]|tara:strand:- start:1363 stop:1758 length:396 start_codon:yes stop_codon:yes gene_type:complete
MKSSPFVLQKTVVKSDLDTLDHVNNVIYLQWVQEVAKAHWEKATGHLKEDFGHWIVRSHHITYKQAVKLGDKLQIETYVKHSRGALSERLVNIFLQNSRILMAHCSTQWCYVSTDTHKPISIPKSVIEILN